MPKETESTSSESTVSLLDRLKVLTQPELYSALRSVKATVHRARFTQWEDKPRKAPTVARQIWIPV